MTDSLGPLPSLQSPKLVAPLWHTAVLLLVFAALTALGALAQRGVRWHPPNPAAAIRLAPLQIQAIIFEWATAVWVWFGARRKGVRICELVAGRWISVSSILADFALGGALWLLWVLISRVENFFLGPDRALGAIPYPSSALEIFLAITVALSAGFCEELVFRGYLQKQFFAMTGSAVIGVILQAAVFGIAHIYQGVRLAAMVVLYGVLFGWLALWRRSLRPGILAHCWSDLAARLLRL